MYNDFGSNIAKNKYGSIINISSDLGLIALTIEFTTTKVFQKIINQ